MKELKENLAALDAYRTADTVNHEGFAAWTPSDAMLLEQFAMTGTLGHSFYASAREQTAAAMALLDRAEPESIAKAIVRGRQEGFIRAFPILGLVKLSVKSPALFQKVFEQVVLTGNDLGDFLDLVRRTRGLGRGVKRAIHSWLDRKLTPYYAMKYRTPVADAIRLSRYRGEDPLCSFVLSAYAHKLGTDEEKLRAAEAKYPALKTRAEFIAAVEAGETAAAAELLRESRIDTDSLTAYYDRFDKELWSAVAEAAPVMKFLKYLAKFEREGVDVDRIAAEKLSVESLRRAKVFPFRLYTAEAALRAAASAEKTQSAAVCERLSQLLDQYAVAYDWEEFNRFSWMIAPDVSGSMNSRIAKSSLTFSELSAMFVGFFMKGLRNVQVLPWDTETHEYTVPASAAVSEHMKAIRSMCGGGTYMEAALKDMLKRKVGVDFAVFLTDTEEYGSGWLGQWKRYRRLFPEAQAFLLRADAYQSSPISEEDAAKYGVWQIFGWNDSVIEFMRFVLKRRSADSAAETVGPEQEPSRKTEDV